MGAIVLGAIIFNPLLDDIQVIIKNPTLGAILFIIYKCFLVYWILSLFWIP